MSKGLILRWKAGWGARVSFPYYDPTVGFTALPGSFGSLPPTIEATGPTDVQMDCRRRLIVVVNF